MEDSSQTFRIVSVSSSAVAAEKVCGVWGVLPVAAEVPNLSCAVPMVTMAVGFVMEMLLPGLCCRNSSQEQNTLSSTEIPRGAGSPNPSD